MNRKKYLLSALLLTMVTAGWAQPPARQAEAAMKKQKTNANNLTLRAKLTFPTANPVSEDVVW
ncbi:MAG: gliding motility protein GldN, partial [Prevotella sp.]|nr:gliding motility protein GldN [Prevotella sp.]